MLDDETRLQLTLWAKQFNEGLSKYEDGAYFSKKHLLDYVDGYLSMLVEKYDLNIE